MSAMTAADRRAHKASMTVLSDWHEILATLDKEPDFIGLDLETSGLSFNRDRIAVIALYGQETNTAGIIHLRGATPPPEVMAWLAHPSRKLITHNGTQFDIPFLQRNGLKDYRQPEWFDTLIGEQVVLTTDRKDVKVNLKDTLNRRLGVAIPKNVDHATWMQAKLDDAQMRYLADDIYYLPRLRESQLARAVEQDSKYQRNEDFAGVRDAMRFEQRLAPIVAGMVMRGIPIDLPAFYEYTRHAMEEIPEHKRWLCEHLGLEKLGHSPTVVAAIAERYGIDLGDTRADTLKMLAMGTGELAQLAQRLLKYRAGSKRGSMYDDAFIEKYIHEGRLYGNFWQVGTNTGRFSSSSPNLQQLPRDMRYVFGDPSGIEAIVAADYAAIEVCCAADLYQDEALLEAVASEDMHSYTAAGIFGIPMEEVTKEQRRMAKASNFNLTFGGGFKTLYLKARADGSTASFDEVKAFGEQWLRRFPGVAKARERAYWKADLGRPVALTLPTGLRRVLMPRVDLMGTTILNTSVQGMAAAGLKEGIFEMDKAGISQYLAAVIHDEALLTAPMAIANDVAAELERCMVTGMQKVTDAPVAVDAKGGDTWG